MKVGLRGEADGIRPRLAINLAAVADAYDVDNQALAAHARNHAPVTHSVLPVTGPGSGQRLTQPAGIVRFQNPLVDEALYAPLDLLIKGGQLVPRRRMKLNGPGQAAS